MFRYAVVNLRKKLCVTAGATREAITKEALKRMTVPLPPLELQQEFASFVAQVDKSQFALEQEVDALSAERDALLDRFLA